MKKIFTLLLVAIFSSMTITSCTNDDDYIQYEDNDTIAEVYEIRNASFGYNKDLGYYIENTFKPEIYSSDMVLVYQKTGTESGKNVWTLLPRTIYFNDGNEVNYTFDFTTSDVYIYADATFDLNNTDYIKNQTFRILVIPAYGIQPKSQSPVNYNDYNAVVDYYKINDTKVKSF